MLQADRKHLAEVQDLIVRERKEKQKAINKLTKENHKLLNELEERDQRHA